MLNKNYIKMFNSKSLLLIAFALVAQISNAATTLSNSSSFESNILIEDDNNLKFDFKNKITDKIESTSTTQAPLPEVSKTTMDIITIIWYLSTFLALAAFFFLMACSDRKCGRGSRQGNDQLSNDQLQCPPTPSPSYSEFAPPSYESVMNHIFVVPIDLKLSEKKSSTTLNNLTSTTDCRVHTVNELQKIG